MALHPIRVLDHVTQEYREHLLTEFRAKDPDLRRVLEEAIERPLFLAQEPFFQAHRPFQEGRPWADHPLDPQLARAMSQRTGGRPAWKHQSVAIDYLLGSDASALVVTTGTGSGKTEAFLLPVIQNALADATRFPKRPGLTAILVYPMNALANDQELRIQEILQESGYEGTVTVAKYDRGTSQAEREALRTNPPHILLTNYMMLEYLLVRPADREGIFANHRVRFLVLDEVHTYRGSLGANIALLVRRLRAHLASARRDGAQGDVVPRMVTVGTSATIKSLTAEKIPEAERVARRNAAVQEFFGALAGVTPEAIEVVGEELREIVVPEEARYGPVLDEPWPGNPEKEEEVRQVLVRSAGLPAATPLEEAARKCRLLWDLARWLPAAPMSIPQIVERMRKEVPERENASDEALFGEVEALLNAGAALRAEYPNALRLRVHRFLRGGWNFQRCLDPACGRLYPMGEQNCECGRLTAPLFLCRSCGADYLRLAGDQNKEALRPARDLSEGPEWMVYDPGRFEGVEVDEEEEGDAEEDKDEGGDAGDGTPAPPRGSHLPMQFRGRPVLDGSLDPGSLLFSPDPKDYSRRVRLLPTRQRCLCCGGSAGSRAVITPVSLGTSAAVKVVGEGLVEGLAEANADRPNHDGKERLLVFSDSRQDAAHQARFISFASRYDRLRQRLVHLLKEHESLPLQRVVELLGEMGVQARDNPFVPEGSGFISGPARARIRAWEEAPLLDEIAVNSAFRATVVNLGLVGVSYEGLEKFVSTTGKELAGRLGLDVAGTVYLLQCMLNEMRAQGALSREMLRYHPLNSAFPEYIGAANWERRVRTPIGYAADDRGNPVPWMDATALPPGIKHLNLCRRPGAGGRGPRLEQLFKHLLDRLGGVSKPDAALLVSAIETLIQAGLVVWVELAGARACHKLLQVNAETVSLNLLKDGERLRCEVCGARVPLVAPGRPCPRCPHGALVLWPAADLEKNRYVRRIRAKQGVILVAREHTAQVTGEVRVELERQFKAPAKESPVNVLACSPTMEMGIDVGGLDAVVLRNVPPRPDNYAQRGGRAGRRTRVGLVVGYARRTPHDQYFYDFPEEMIAGEVPAPPLSLGNRDVALRHLTAIVLGLSTPGLSGRMADYVGPKGIIDEGKVVEFLAGIEGASEKAVEIAMQAWGAGILSTAGLTEDDLRRHLQELPKRIRDLFQRTARQIIELRGPLDRFAERVVGGPAGHHAAEMIRRLLGLPADKARGQAEADDRSSGYPLRRFAEFGLLPGYEFPSEPAALRLLGDKNEDSPVTVGRHFGIGQFQPEASVYARGRRWKVIGLDHASPWNPQDAGPNWEYRVCDSCGLFFEADHPSCPRCGSALPGKANPAREYGGFLARPDESPVLDEEERIATPNLVHIHPQWDGQVTGRWWLESGWGLRLSRRESVRWLNEGPAPSQAEMTRGEPILRPGHRGFRLCETCGLLLHTPESNNPKAGRRGRRKPIQSPQGQDLYGHATSCPKANQPPVPVALTCSSLCEVLRLFVPVPPDAEEHDLQVWGLSLGYALRAGMRQLFMLDGPEIEFVFESRWPLVRDGQSTTLAALSFLDPSLGGSGFLPRIAAEFHWVAARALQHLNHPGCEKACYRCLKSYANQRYHEFLNWPQIVNDLEMLAETPPHPRPLEASDLDDPRPWLDAYSAGYGSPLEHRFGRAFEEAGFSLVKQHPISDPPGTRPFTIADFALPDRKIAIYIDGAVFHRGPRLRRDRSIRTRLTQPPLSWTVLQLRAPDLPSAPSLLRALLSPPSCSLNSEG